MMGLFGGKRPQAAGESETATGRELSAQFPREREHAAAFASEVEPILQISRDELSAMQLERLRATVTRAYERVPFYKDAFDKKGVTPDDLRTLADLKHFPFTVKDDFRANYPFGMFAEPMENIARVHASSGTTGKPTVVGYTASDIKTWASMVARSIRASGGRPGDMVHVAYGYGLFTGGLGAHYGAEAAGCTAIPMSGGQGARQVQLITDFKPRIIMVTPSYLLALADEFDRAGVDPRESSLEIGILGAEPWGEAMRAEIEQRFAIDAVDIYGMSELMGPGVSNECAATKDGPTIWEDHFYPEIINPDTGEPAGEGERGELVFTSLTKEALPIVRYRTRDLSALLPGTAFTHRRMARIHARTDDMLIIRGVNVFPSQIEEMCLKDDRIAPHYLIEVERDGALDRVRLTVEQRSASADDAQGADIAASLQERIKTQVGISVDVRVGAPDTIERSQGKAKRVIDRRTAAYEL